MIRPAKYLRKQSSQREQIVESPKKKSSAESDADAASSVGRPHMKPTQLEATQDDTEFFFFLPGKPVLTGMPFANANANCRRLH